MLFIQKKTKFYDENVNCKKDLKKKFKNLSDLLGENEAPVLPTTHGNDYMLACAFGAFFKKKVQCIRDSIPTVEPDQYISKSTAAPMLEFCEISRDVLEKSLAGLSNSTCSLDPLPTIKLKETKNCWIRPKASAIGHFLLSSIQYLLSTTLYMTRLDSGRDRKLEHSK